MRDRRVVHIDDSDADCVGRALAVGRDGQLKAEEPPQNNLNKLAIFWILDEWKQKKASESDF